MHIGLASKNMNPIDIDRATTPTSPYDQFKPNTRNTIIKPLLGGGGENNKAKTPARIH